MQDCSVKDHCIFRLLPFRQNFRSECPPGLVAPQTSHATPGDRGLDAERAPGSVELLRIKIQQVVHLVNRHLFRTRFDEFESVARANFAFL